MKKLVAHFRRGNLWRWIRRAFTAAILLIVSLVVVFQIAVAAWTYPKDIERMPADSVFLCDVEGTPLAEFAAADDQWRMTLSESEISPHLFHAMVAAEDARFYEHHGVDWKSAVAALWQDAISFRARRGGSTITMQLQRLRQGVPHTLAGKFEQAVRATQLEKTRSKREILVEYLNRAPFGGNLVGAGAASWRYFGRSCRELSLGQAALLAGLPKNPTGDRPDRFPGRAKARRDFVLGRMLALKMIGVDEYVSAIAEPIDATWHPLAQSTSTPGQSAGSYATRASPRILPVDDHENAIAIQSALPTLTRLAHQSSGGQIRTTLDLATQKIVASAAREHMEQQGDGINEMAVVVVETATSNCIVAVSLSRSGVSELDLTQRPRSTGSVIKPLIYAAAFDAGISSPAAMLDDSPAAWAGYAPNNYDQQFRGRMSAGDALAQSRNIPAIKLLSQVGVERTVGACSAMGLETLARTPQRYGLSLAIGGAEATVCEVAEAYVALARGGVHRNLNWVGTGSLKLPSQIINVSQEEGSVSRRACADVLSCLNDVPRTVTICPEAVALRPAWKTGTSSGHRDAWCAVVGPAHVIVVWMGNANALGSQAIVGAEVAAPLALRLIAAVDARVPVKPVERSAMPQLAAARFPETQLNIVSPVNGVEIIWLAEVAAAQQKVLLRATVSSAPSGDAKVFWFIDGSPVGECNSGESCWWEPVAGSHEVRAVDQNGHADQIKITVR